MKADKAVVRKLLNTAKGQLEGISAMVEENRYCLDISNQILASIAILKRVNRTILEAHLQSCVNDTLNEEGKVKLAEIVQFIDKLQ
jgi:DNA-binding FrmR family transcriptional regulator